MTRQVKMPIILALCASDHFLINCKVTSYPISRTILGAHKKYANWLIELSTLSNLLVSINMIDYLFLFKGLKI